MIDFGPDGSGDVGPVCLLRRPIQHMASGFLITFHPEYDFLFYFILIYFLLGIRILNGFITLLQSGQLGSVSLELCEYI